MLDVRECAALSPSGMLQGASNGDLKGRCCVVASYDSGTTVGPAADRMYQTPQVLFAKSERPPPYSRTCAPGPGAYGKPQGYKCGIKCAFLPLSA